jgi:hypothetical protein
VGKKSTPAAPAAPDPTATAAAQEKNNVGSAVAQANLNRIDQYTPQGSLTYKQIGTNGDGTPQYAQTQTLSADEQTKYDQANKVAIALNGTAMNNIDKVNDVQSKDFNYDSMTPQVTHVSSGGIATGIAPAGRIQTNLDYSHLDALPKSGDFNQAAQAAADASYKQATSRLDPRFQQEQSDLSSRLVNSGIPVGSEAYNREMTNYSNEKNDAYNQAAYSSQAAGLAAQGQGYDQALSTRQQGVSEVDNQGQFANGAQSQQFGQNQTDATFHNQAQQQRYNEDAGNAALQNAGRQQQIQEATTLRNLPLNDIAALMSGSQVNNPQFNPVAQVGVAAPDYMGAVYKNYDAANQQYQAAQANKTSFMGTVAGLAGTLGSAAIKNPAMFSDRRLKRNIREIGVLANGIKTYAFNYLWSTAQQFGVMAQEVLAVIPDAVIMDDSGYMMVDYGKVY